MGKSRGSIGGGRSGLGEASIAVIQTCPSVVPRKMLVGVRRLDRIQEHQMDGIVRLTRSGGSRKHAAKDFRGDPWGSDERIALGGAPFQNSCERPSTRQEILAIARSGAVNS